MNLRIYHMAPDCLKIWFQQQGCRREFWVYSQYCKKGLRFIHSAAKKVQVHPQCCRKGAGPSTVLHKRCRSIHSAAGKVQVRPQCCTKGAGPSTVLQKRCRSFHSAAKGAGPSTMLQERCRSTLEIYVHYFTELLCRGGVAGSIAGSVLAPLSLVHR
jgi:hypothetical protein